MNSPNKINDLDLKLAKLKLDSTCGELGWGWAGAEISEVSNILRAGIDLEKLGVSTVWEDTIHTVSEDSYSALAAGREVAINYLLQCARKYATGIKDGIYRDLDKKTKGNYNSVFEIINKLEKVVSEKS